MHQIPCDRIRDEAKGYLESIGLARWLPLRMYLPLDKARARDIARQYDEAAHAPHDLAVRGAYDAFKAETLAQWNWLRDCGVHFQVWPWEHRQPYNGSLEMIRDCVNNHHLWFYAPAVLPFDHPLAEYAPGTPYLYNHVFRCVHDYFGHAMNGYGFSPRGEENAWSCHSDMYSPLARAAMTTETRGQNSWVNFGPHGEYNRRNPGQTIYAPQKACLLPDAGLYSLLRGANDEKWNS